MATLYPTQDAGPTNWSAANWSLADDNAKNHVKPANADVVIFTVNSGSIDLDENSANLASLDMTGYAATLDITVFGGTITVAGDCTLDGTLANTSASGSLTVGGDLVLVSGLTFDITLGTTMTGGTITSNAVVYGTVTVSSGTVTMLDNFTFAACPLTGGTWNTGGFDMAVGAVVMFGGTLNLGSSSFTYTANFLNFGTAITINGGDLVGSVDMGLNGGSFTALGDFSSDLNGNDFKVAGGTLDLGSSTWTQTNGDGFTHTSGTVTCTSDNSATIDAAGNTLSNITASNIIDVINGTDGGGNTKLNFGGAGGGRGSGGGMMSGIM